MDPWGHLTGTPSGPGKAAARAGVDVQPTIAVSECNLKLPEVLAAMEAGRLAPCADGKILKPDGVCAAVKCAIEPVWFLPGIAKRFKLDERVLRQKARRVASARLPRGVRVALKSGRRPPRSYPLLARSPCASAHP